MENGFSLKKTERLRRRVDFQRIYSQGKCFQEDNLRFYVLKHSPSSFFKEEISDARGWENSRDNSNRIGFVVSKKVSKRAVIRNRVRRLLKEAYRQNKGKLKDGRDLVVVAKEGADELSFREGQEALLQLFRKAGLIRVK